MRIRSWASLVLLVGLVAGLACGNSGRRSSFCGAYADTVEACCEGEVYAELRLVCQQDLDGAATLGGACARSVRDYYDCVEQAACMDACLGGADPCTAYIDTMIGACNQSPPPPEL